jgi:nitroimidazol reductase NimA-like FMN-containing flavoprotein (pyridoxamine 5'-phosphate oxidase superfamily)
MDPMTIEETIRFLSEALVAHLGLISEGKPYVTPMSFVLDHGRILFRTQPGRKLEAIAESPSVCIEACSFDESTGDWLSVIVNGRAAETIDPAVGERAIALLLEKYANQLGSPLGIGGLQPLASMPHLIEVVIDDVSGMTSGSSFGPRTRPGRL